MTICFHCAGEFFWTRTAEGKRPLNVSDGKPHWMACRAFRKAGKARKKRAEIRGPLTKYTCTTTGGEYRQPCGQCTKAPWEACDCSAMMKPEGFSRHQKALDAINSEADARLQDLLELAGQA